MRFKNKKMSCINLYILISKTSLYVQVTDSYTDVVVVRTKHRLVVGDERCKS